MNKAIVISGVNQVLEIAKETGFEGPYVKLIQTIAQEAERGKGRSLPCNADTRRPGSNRSGKSVSKSTPTSPRRPCVFTTRPIVMNVS